MPNKIVCVYPKYTKYKIIKYNLINIYIVYDLPKLTL